MFLDNAVIIKRDFDWLKQLRFNVTSVTSNNSDNSVHSLDSKFMT